MQNRRIIALAVLNTVLSIFGSVMNSLVVLVILTNKNLQKGLNLLILSLATAGLLTCAIAQPMYVHAILYCTDEASMFQEALIVVALITLHALTLNLVAITIHRWKALSRPFTHLLLVSKKHASLAIGGVWIVSILMGVFFATKPGKLVAAYVHLAMTLAWIGGYIRLFCLVKKQRSKIASLECSPTAQFQKASIKFENEALKTSAILVGLSLLCFFPNIIFDFMGHVDEIRMAWEFTVLFLNSSLNPCVFIWRSHQFREVLAKNVRHVWRGRK